jgi:hypothetical protein
MLTALGTNGIVLAVVSSDSETNARAALGGCARHIRYFECGASLFGKAAKYTKVLSRAGIAADQTIAIGDEVRDGEAARKAGIAFGAVSWGFASLEALQKLDPEFVFARIDEIPLKLSRVGKSTAPDQGKMISGQLDVGPQQVVPGQGESADGCFRFYATVRPMPIVSVQPDGEFLCAAIGRGIGLSVRPLPERRLNEALGLAVGFGRVGLGADVFEAQFDAGVAKGKSPIAAAIIGHDTGDSYAEAFVIGDGGN